MSPPHLSPAPAGESGAPGFVVSHCITSGGASGERPKRTMPWSQIPASVVAHSDFWALALACSSTGEPSAAHLTLPCLSWPFLPLWRRKNSVSRMTWMDVKDSFLDPVASPCSLLTRFYRQYYSFISQIPEPCCLCPTVSPLGTQGSSEPL